MTRPLPPYLFLFLPLVLALQACAEFPEVGRAESLLSPDATAPALLTVEEMAALSTGPVRGGGALADEAARLRERANRLRRR
jgi:hypothetical protein